MHADDTAGLTKPSFLDRIRRELRTRQEVASFFAAVSLLSLTVDRVAISFRAAGRGMESDASGRIDRIRQVVGRFEYELIWVDQTDEGSLSQMMMVRGERSHDHERNKPTNAHHGISR